MAAKNPEIRERDVRGLKYFDQLAPLLERLDHHKGDILLFPVPGLAIVQFVKE